MRSRLAIVLLAVALALAGCGKKAAKERAPASDGGAGTTASTVVLTDISTSLAAAREAFNAHKGEARFLTLLSPT